MRPAHSDEGASWSCSLRVLTGLAGGLMATTMLFTYVTCVHGKYCPALPHLPTISNTWSTPPGNYVSRFVVSVVSLLFFSAQFPLWLPAKVKHASFHCTVGCAAVFLLSWIGAICDSNNPQCRGWPEAHDIIAVSFFILYNYNMIVFSFSASRRADRLAVGMPTVLSLLTKVRWIPAVAAYLAPDTAPTWAPADQTPLAIVEWSDVFIIVGWTVGVVWTKRADYACTITPALPARATVRISCKQSLTALVTLFIGTLVTCLYFYFEQGRVQKGTWPYISDTFVHKPGDWISRWAVVLGGSFAIITQVLLYVMDTHVSASSSGSVSDRTLTALAIIACLGVMGVGCVDESEDIAIHGTCAGFFFVGYDLYMILRSATQIAKAASPSVRLSVDPSVPSVESAVPTPAKYEGARPSVGVLSSQLCLAVLSSVLTYIRFTDGGNAWLRAAVDHKQTSRDVVGDLLLPIFEWLDAISIICYLILAVLSYGALSTSVGVFIDTTKLHATRDTPPITPLP